MILDDFTKSILVNVCFDIYNEAFAGIERAPEGLFKSEFAQGDVFVVGSGVVGPNQLDSSGSIEGFAIVIRKQGVPYIWAVAVREGFRGKGFGTALLDEIAEWAKLNHEDAIELTVKQDNPAQTLYFKKGWRVVAVLRNFYLDAGDGLLMRRII